MSRPSTIRSPLHIESPLLAHASLDAGAVERRQQTVRRIALGGALLALGCGVAVALGWFLDLPGLTKLHPALPSMKFTTAVLFMLTGTCIALASRGEKPRVRKTLALVVMLLAGATLGQDIFGFDLGIDQLLVRDLHPLSGQPGRMAPSTGLAFVFLGGALWRVGGGRNALGFVLTVASLLIAVLSTCGYVYGAHALYSIGRFTGMALHTALGLLVASVSLIAAQPTRAPMLTLTSGTRAGRSLRRGLPWVAIMSPTLGWLALQGVSLGYYNANLAVALLVLSNLTSVTATALIVGARMHRLQLQDAKDQRLLFGLGELLGAPGAPEQTLVKATRYVAETFGASRCLFAEVNQDLGVVTLRAQHEPGMTPTPLEVPYVNFSPESRAELSRGVVTVNHDTAADPRTTERYLTEYKPLGLRATLHVPLIREGHWVGVLVVASDRPRRWEDGEVVLAAHVASLTWTWYQHRLALEALRGSQARNAVILDERQQLLDDLTKLTRELEQRVEERTRELRFALREKEVLLKEIHHRVKNNLQVISSLLNLQSNHVEDAQLKAILAETQSRVLSIALVHEKLYQSRDLSHIGFDDYVRVLVRGLMHSNDVARRNITVTFELQAVRLSVDMAVPCGMVISELVSNAFKHAFAPTDGGHVTVKLSVLEGDRVEVVVADDGRGIPTDLDLRRTNSLGMELVFAFADQLGAVVNIERGAGTVVRLNFPLGG